MSDIGITKEFDKLGRIVIPKDFRLRYGLEDGVEIIATKEGVILKSPKYCLVEKRAAQMTVKLENK